MLKGRTIAVCVTGGIAAYKACELVSGLKKLGADIHVVMTENATKFVLPLTFETLTGNRVLCDMFDQNRSAEVEHVSLAKKADLFVVAPCTANVAGKLAAGIADDFVTTVVMATKKPVLIAPAMNTNMIQSAAYIANENTLKSRGFLFVNSGCGLLACGDIGQGRLAPIPQIIENIKNILLPNRDFAGKKVLVTAGATIENIDPVRYISNRSSGKMGLAIAAAAARRGAQVTVVAGHITQQVENLYTTVFVDTTQQMHKCVMENLPADFVIMAAAPCDYRVDKVSAQKIKDKQLSLSLAKNTDIAAEVGRDKQGSKLIIFAAETENLFENAQKKLEVKNADMVVANDVTKSGAGFDVDTNIVTIFARNVGESGAESGIEKTEIGLTAKSALADIILDKATLLK